MARSLKKIEFQKHLRQSRNIKGKKLKRTRRNRRSRRLYRKKGFKEKIRSKMNRKEIKAKIRMTKGQTQNLKIRQSSSLMS